MLEFTRTNDDTTPRPYLTREQLEARYPRVLKLISWCGILSRGEATAALRDYRANISYSSEAVTNTATLMQRVGAMRTNYTLLSHLGIGTQENCRACIDWRRCNCACRMCADTRTVESQYE